MGGLPIIYIGELVIVEGISQRGKNRISEHGVVWKVINSNLSNGILLESCDAVDNTWRWVSNYDDPDFKIIKTVDLDNMWESNND